MPRFASRTRPFVRRGLRWTLAASLVLVLAACGTTPEPEPEPEPDPDPTPEPTIEAVYRVNAGTTLATTPDDLTNADPTYVVDGWIADDEGSVTVTAGRPYPNGTEASSLVEGDIDASADGAGPAALYLSTRGVNSGISETQFSYSLPIDALAMDANDTLTLRLHFAEIFHNTIDDPDGVTDADPNFGNRIFDVSIEGVLELDDFDIEAAAGADATTEASMTAVVREFTGLTDTTGNDAIDVVFTNGSADNAQVSAIELDVVRNP